jgi:hypothetical protein
VGGGKAGVIMRNLKSTRKRVHYILLNYPETRRSDKELYIKYVEVFGIRGLKKYEERTFIRLMRKADLPHCPTIWRFRQDFQRREPALFDGLTARKRRELEREYRAFFREDYGKA